MSIVVQLKIAETGAGDSHISSPAITGRIKRATFHPTSLPSPYEGEGQGEVGFALASGRVCHARSVTRGRFQ